jgi:SAM-dependent methyltransferase
LFPEAHFKLDKETEQTKMTTNVNPVEYWNDMRLGQGHACHNVTLFRLLGYSGIGLERKNVLEIGFGANRGADLLECKARGSVVHGVDINASYVKDFADKYPDIPVAVMNAGLDRFPFDAVYDLIFHRDVIYYLSNEEIAFHFRNAYDNLSPGGHLVFQFIEKDLTIARNEIGRDSYKLNLQELHGANSDLIFRGETNPIRKLDIDWLIGLAAKTGFKLKATKTVIESYSPNESVYRVDRYLLLEKYSASSN